MFFSTREALQILSQEQVDERYGCASIYLLEHRYEFDVPIYINRPEVCPPDVWEVISADTTPMCFCGGERILMPVFPRTSFEEGLIVNIPSGTCIDLKPRVGGRFAVYVRIEVHTGKVVFDDNPYASSFYTRGRCAKRDYDLTTLASVIGSSQRKLIYTHSVEGVTIPIFTIECVDLYDQSVTISLDKGVELCIPNGYGDHFCIDVGDVVESP